MRHLKGVSNIETVTARLYFIYGPNQDAGTGYPSVITKNFERIDAGQRPLVYGDGSQTLDYLYIDDCIDAILMLMNAQNRHRIYNICSGSYISIRELTDLMIGISKSKLKPMQCDPDWTQGTIRSGSCSRILNEYGWQPKVNLLEGLRMVYNAVSNK
jgi:UDP-glucose 4-epimerase